MGRVLLQNWFPTEEFSERRDKVFDAINGACALLQGAGPVGGFDVFRQTNDFFYLSGIEIPQAYLLLDGSQRTTTLYIPPGDPKRTSEGPTPLAEDEAEIRTEAGVDAVCPVDALEKQLSGVDTVFTPHGPAEGRLSSRGEMLRAAQAVAADPWDGEPTREERFIAKIRERCPSVEIRDLTAVLDEMRLIKSPRELAVLRRAGELCAQAVVEVMRSARSAQIEYQLCAVADYVYRVNGAVREGYHAIMPCGPNIWFGHYSRNDQPLVPGELVLMDYAPEVCYYTSDIGRMFPVSGTYAALHRELYGFVVEYHKALLRRIGPGALPHEVLAACADEMRPVIDGWGFSKPIYREAALRMLEFTGHLSHTVGMAVHDVGKYFDVPMRPGLVFSVDPQMWIPEERRYVRVEDTVAVTSDGVVVLTAAAPLDLNDVEALMHEDGLRAELPPLPS
jgi:Xaa-Pro aminopeptidase